MFFNDVVNFIVYMSDLVRPPTSTSADDEHYKQRIKHRILEQAYNRDSEANRPNDSNTHLSNNIKLTEIQEMYPAMGDIESFRREARGMDMRDEPLIEFVGNIDEDIIRITDKGRIYWEEKREQDISDMDL
jgi:hypothetical protein